MSDSSSGPDRPVREAPRSGQQTLFGASPQPPGEGRGEKKSGECHFVERNPEEITIGGKPLGAYLKERDQAWILAVRERLRAVDWESWEAKYEGGGRPPYHPAPMAALVIYGVMEGKSSLRELEDLARTDLRCMWLTGGIQPDHSTVGRYICRHSEQLQAEGFLELTETLLEVLPDVSQEVAGDGTVLEAFASRVSKLKTEAAEQWAADKLEEESEGEAPKEAENQRDEAKGGSREPEGESRQEKRRARKLLEMIEERLEERSHHGGNREQTKFSRTEPEAVWHRYKDKRYGFGYISSVFANRQRFIVGQALDRTSEKAVLEELLEQAEAVFERIGGSDGGIERLSLDNNYYALGVLETVVERKLDTLIPPDAWEPDGREELPRRGGKFAKQAFDYDAERDVYVCPAGVELEKIQTGTDRNGRSHASYGRSPACEECPRRESCTDSKQGRTIKRYEKDALKEGMREVMGQDRAQEAYRRRMGIVEPVFAAFRRRGWNRARRRGRRGASTELALHSIGHNFDRFRAYITSGRLELEGLGTQTGSYTETPGKKPGGPFLGANRGRFSKNGAIWRGRPTCRNTIAVGGWRPHYALV